MSFIENIQKRLLENVIYKFSLIFSCLYVVIYMGENTGMFIYFYLFISILLSVGIAGIGYVLNDLVDYKDDVINKKRNLFINLSRFKSSALIILLVICAIFPWFYLPFTKISLSLVLLELLLFGIYILPPFRLKERGLWGIACDSLYARVLPCLLAVYTYSIIVKLDTVNYLLLTYITVWLFLIGVRNIISHQIDDFSNDENTNTSTYVRKIGILRAESILKFLLIPLEFVLFLIISFSIPGTKGIIGWIFVVFAAYVFFHNRKTIDQKYPYYFDKRIFNEFYEIYLPILILLIYSIQNGIFWGLLFFNLIAFFPIFLNFLKLFKQKYF